MVAGARDAAALGLVAAALEGNHELVRGAAPVGLVERQAAAHHRLDQREVGDQIHVPLVRGDRRGPGDGRPVERVDLVGLDRRKRRLRRLGEALAEAGGVELERAQRVVAAAQVEPVGATALLARLAGRLALDLVGRQRDIGVGILREAARRGDQQAAMVGQLFEQALDRLQAEGDRLADQLDVAVGRIDGATVGQIVGDRAGRHALDGRTARRRYQGAERPDREDAPPDDAFVGTSHAAQISSGL